METWRNSETVTHIVRNRSEYLMNSSIPRQTDYGVKWRYIAMPGMNDALSYIIFGIFVFAIIVFALFSAG